MKFSYNKSYFNTEVEVTTNLFNCFVTDIITLFNRRNLKYFVNCQNMSAFRCVYAVPMAWSLREYVHQSLTADDYFKIILDYIDALEELETNGYILENMIVDYDYIFVDLETRVTKFLYVPCAIKPKEFSYYNFFFTLLYAPVLKNHQDAQKLEKIRLELMDLKMQNIYSLSQKNNTIRSKIKELSPHLFAFQKKSEEKHEEKYDDWANEWTEDNEEKTTQIDEEKTVQIEDEEKTVQYDEEKTVQLEEVRIRIAKLTRLSNNETVHIDKSIYKIGKSATCDFIIGGNPTISRQHAEIRARNDEFYFVDLESLNKSFINNNQALPNQEVLLSEKETIKLANEEFAFTIEELNIPS